MVWSLDGIGLLEGERSRDARRQTALHILERSWSRRWFQRLAAVFLFIYISPHFFCNERR
jgi:hypothetical protein